MKALKLFSLITICLAITSITNAQNATTETFAVSGNCGMCKKKIETAAKDAGATYALWDVDKKELTVKYSSSTTNTAKIQKKIAEVGYDNAGFTSTTEAYNNLPGCCKYERASGEKMACCKDGKCEKKDHGEKACCTDGKCEKEKKGDKH